MEEFVANRESGSVAKKLFDSSWYSLEDSVKLSTNAFTDPELLSALLLIVSRTLARSFLIAGPAFSAAFLISDNEAVAPKLKALANFKRRSSASVAVAADFIALSIVSTNCFVILSSVFVPKTPVTQLDNASTTFRALISFSTSSNA